MIAKCSAMFAYFLHDNTNRIALSTMFCLSNPPKKRQTVKPKSICEHRD